MKDGAGEVRAARHVALGLGSAPLTLAYWSAIALYAAALALPQFPAVVDYPQHLAVSALLRRFLGGDASVRALYTVNPFTYNGSVHFVVALLAFVMPVELAGRVVLSALPAVVGVASLAIVRAARRPTYFAFALLPLCFSHSVGWGFLNFVFGAAVAAIGTARLLRSVDDLRGPDAVDAALAALVAVLHILAAALLCLGYCVVLAVQLAGDRLDLRAAARRAVFVAPAILLSAFFVAHNAGSSHSNWEEAQYDGLDLRPWEKLFGALSFTVGNLADRSDVSMLALGLGVLVAAGALPGRGPGRVELRWLATAGWALYLFVPRVFMATWYVFERFAPVALVFTVGALPAPRAALGRWVAPALAVLGLAGGANAIAHAFRLPHATDAAAMLDALPRDRRVFQLSLDQQARPIFTSAVYLHLIAYHQVRTGAEVAPTFTRVESMPIHYRPGRAPPAIPRDRRRYAAAAQWARSYPVVLIHAREGDDPTKDVFGEDAPHVVLLARHGPFWLFDTAQVQARPGVL